MAETPTFNLGEDKAPEEKKGDYIKLGAVWGYENEGYENSMFSINIDLEAQKHLVNIFNQAKGEPVTVAMFPNNNRREGKNDPHYYIVPPKDYKG